MSEDIQGLANNGEQKVDVDEFEFAHSLVRQAGEYIRSALSEGYDTQWKSDNTPVTSIDIAVNKMVIEQLHQQFPQDRIYGEEESAEAEGDGGMTWVLDPIDGTQSIGLFPTATCCLARLDAEGQPLFSFAYNPGTEEMFAAKRGERATLNGEPIHVSEKTTVKSSYIFLGSRLPADVASNGVVYDRLEEQGAKIINTRSLAFGCLMVAVGKAEGAYIGAKTPFEAATVKLIAEGAGATVTDLYGGEGGRLDGEIRGMVVSNGQFHDQLVAALRPVESQQ